jgi:hypothetical protein
MNHSIKINRIRRQMSMAAYPRTVEAIMASIPSGLLAEIPSKYLVLIANALHMAHRAGKDQAERDVLAEGTIYSPAAGRMLEVR